MFVLGVGRVGCVGVGRGEDVGEQRKIQRNAVLMTHKYTYIAG